MDEWDAAGGLVDDSRVVDGEVTDESRAALEMVGIWWLWVAGIPCECVVDGVHHRDCGVSGESVRDGVGDVSS